MSGARFVGVGVGEYDKGLGKLPRAVPDVQEFAGLLPDAFDRTVLCDPDEQAVRTCLRGLPESMPDRGALVLLWSGHAIPAPPDGLRLLTRDSGGHLTDGLAASDPATIAGLRPGAYTIDLRGEGRAAPFAPVSSDLLVWPATFAP